MTRRGFIRMVFGVATCGLIDAITDSDDEEGEL